MLVIAIFLIFVLLYQFDNKTAFYIFCLYMVTAGFWLCLKADSSMAPVIFHIIPLACLYSIYPFLKKYGKFLAFSFFIFILYLLFKSLFWEFSFFSNFMILKNSLFCICLGFSFWENYKVGKVNFNSFYNSIYFLLLVEIIIGWAQYFSNGVMNFFIVEEYFWRGETTPLTFDINKFTLDGKMMIGTLTTASSYSNFLSVVVFSLFLREILRPTKSIVRYSIIGLGFVTLIFAGIRTPLFMLLLFCMILLHRYKKHLFWAGVFVFVIALSSFSILALSDNTGTIGRILLGLEMIFSGNAAFLTDSTFIYSVLMIPFFLKNPIFGVSQYATTGYVLSSGHVLMDMSIYDSYLMYILCEVGIVGVWLFMRPLLKFRKKTNLPVDSFCYTVVLAFGLSLSIVDRGIFSYVTLILLIFAIMLCSSFDDKLNNNVTR